MPQVIQKNIGETPLQAIQRITKEKATYAGRLDPMASGKLLILTGEETKQRTRYLNLDKEYVVRILLDITTDTGDALGIPTPALQQTKLSHDIIQRALQKECGTHERPYPAFSSKPVAGKPLFTYALAGTLHTIDIPTHMETIHTFELLDTTILSTKQLYTEIKTTLEQVPRSTLPSKALGNDFRQDTVREAWKNLFTNSNRNYQCIEIRVITGSGTYMRSLAKRLGETFGTNAFALSIHRSKIGRYKKFLRWGFWTKQY